MCHSFIKRFSTIAALGLLSLSLASDGFAQTGNATQRKWGLSASIQGGQGEIMVPIWLGATRVIAPLLGVIFRDGIGTTLMPGAMLRFYSGEIQRVTPYFGVGGGASIFSPKVGPSTTDLYGRGVWGAEFFMHSQFSIGVEARVEVVRPDAGGTNISTGTAVHVNIYR